jgi:small subunit ribosomal protein S6
MIKYEMGVVVRADLPDDGFAVEMDKVKALIDRFGGTIDKIDEWGRRRLAYPIAKQTEGMYTFITYTAEPSAPKEIESRVRLIENVLRFLTVRKDEVEAPAVAAAAPVTAPVAEEPVPEAPVPEAPVQEEPAEEEPVVPEAPAETEAPAEAE